MQSLLQPLAYAVCPVGLATAAVLRLRLYAASTTPHFAASDNPLANCDSPMIRFLTIPRWWASHAGLLLYPNTLAFDWSQDAIPLVDTIVDMANVKSAIVLLTLSALFVRCYMELCKERQRNCYAKKGIYWKYSTKDIKQCNHTNGANMQINGEHKSAKKSLKQHSTQSTQQEASVQVTFLIFVIHFWTSVT